MSPVQILSNGPVIIPFKLLCAELCISDHKRSRTVRTWKPSRDAAEMERMAVLSSSPENRHQRETGLQPLLFSVYMTKLTRMSSFLKGGVSRPLLSSLFLCFLHILQFIGPTTEKSSPFENMPWSRKVQRQHSGLQPMRVSLESQESTQNLSTLSALTVMGSTYQRCLAGRNIWKVRDDYGCFSLACIAELSPSILKLDIKTASPSRYCCVCKSISLMKAAAESCPPPLQNVCALVRGII